MKSFLYQTTHPQRNHTSPSPNHSRDTDLLSLVRLTDISREQRKKTRLGTADT